MNAPGLETVALPPLGQVLDLLRLIWAVDHCIQRTSKRMEARLGMTGPQELIIRIIGRFPGITAGQLAQELRVHPSTITGMLKRLESKGLITRRDNPRDRRRCFLGLTEAGRALKDSTTGTVESVVQEVLEALPDASVTATRDVLQALEGAFARNDSLVGTSPAGGGRRRAT